MNESAPGATLKMALWQETVPLQMADHDDEVSTHDGGILRVKNLHEPRLYVYLAGATRARGAAVVICPGGGYGILAAEHEGFDQARWLNTLGISAIVLLYRVAPYRHPVPLMDAQQAVRVVRSHADEWGIDPERIGIMGFSAGGHLASTVMTHGDRPVNAGGEFADVPCHVNAAILGYPVISLVRDGLCHKGSRRNLLGDDPPRDILEELSAETQVRATTPPAFFFHAKDDTAVPLENSTTLAAALQQAGIPTQVCVLERGGHGFGLRCDEWTAACARWLREQTPLGAGMPPA